MPNNTVDAPIISAQNLPISSSSNANEAKALPRSASAEASEKDKLKVSPPPRPRAVSSPHPTPNLSTPGKLVEVYAFSPLHPPHNSPESNLRVFEEANKHDSCVLFIGDTVQQFYLRMMNVKLDEHSGYAAARKCGADWIKNNIYGLKTLTKVKAEAKTESESGAEAETKPELKAEILFCDDLFLNEVPQDEKFPGLFDSDALSLWQTRYSAKSRKYPPQSSFHEDFNQVYNLIQELYNDKKNVDNKFKKEIDKAVVISQSTGVGKARSASDTTAFSEKFNASEAWQLCLAFAFHDVIVMSLLQRKYGDVRVHYPYEGHDVSKHIRNAAEIYLAEERKQLGYRGLLAFRDTTDLVPDEKKRKKSKSQPDPVCFKHEDSAEPANNPLAKSDAGVKAGYKSQFFNSSSAIPAMTQSQSNPILIQQSDAKALPLRAPRSLQKSNSAGEAEDSYSQVSSSLDSKSNTDIRRQNTDAVVQFSSPDRMSPTQVELLDVIVQKVLADQTLSPDQKGVVFRGILGAGVGVGVHAAGTGLGKIAQTMNTYDSAQKLIQPEKSSSTDDAWRPCMII